MCVVVLVAGARPNYPKIAALYAALKAREVDVRIVDTGQHYDPALSSEMREDLGLPDPDIHLEVGSDTHARQTAKVMERFGDVVTNLRPAAVVVVGDVNSTVACALVTSKAWDEHGRRPLLAHVEAGLRSGDRTMPEEINRLVTDCLSDLLFTTEMSANQHLAREGIRMDRVHFVGNVMVDTLFRFTKQVPRVPLSSHIVATLHRPSTVDRLNVLAGVLSALQTVGARYRLPVYLVCHPRTRPQIEMAIEQGLLSLPAALSQSGPVEGLNFLPALRYRKFIEMVRDARLVLTDSGGLQEETTALGVACLTLRESTERPVTVTDGTNRIVGVKPEDILSAVEQEFETPDPGEKCATAMGRSRRRTYCGNSPARNEVLTENFKRAFSAADFQRPLHTVVLRTPSIR